MDPRIMKTVIVAAIVVTALAMSVTLAGHIVGIKGSWTFTSGAPPVYWVAGSNNGTVDVLGNTITATVSPNGTEVSVSAGITYGENQYVDVVEIRLDRAPFNIYLVADPLSSIFNNPNIDLTHSKILIWAPGAETPSYVIPLSELSTGEPYHVGTFDSTGNYRVDLIIIVNDGAPLPSTIDLALKLYYTPGTETPVVG